MADPLPRPGSILLGNTAQVAVDADGYVVLHDPDYLLLETGTTDAMLLETGTTDGLLLEPYDCACCVEGLCGECSATIGDTVTVDLGITNFEGAVYDSYTYCDAPCNSLQGEYVIERLGSHDCAWFDQVPLCERPDGNTRVEFYVWISWGLLPFFLDPMWRINVEIDIKYNNPLFLTWSIVKRIVYTAPTTTICTAKTYTLEKVYDTSSVFGANTHWPCIVSATSDWIFPATIDLIVP